MDKRIAEVEALRQVAFPDFPYYRVACEEVAEDGEGESWTCDRQVDHEGPHMSAYEYDGDGTVIGFAWIDNA